MIVVVDETIMVVPLLPVMVVVVVSLVVAV